MEEIRKEFELCIRASNRLGGEQKVMQILRTLEVHVLASCCYSDRDDGVMLLVATHPAEAQVALETVGFKCKLNSVLLVRAPDRGGIALCMFQIGSQIREAGLEILYSYASTTDDDEVYAVFKTADDEAALRLLEPQFAVPAFHEMQPDTVAMV
jgi:hypothetical protein